MFLKEEEGRDAGEEKKNAKNPPSLSSYLFFNCLLAAPPNLPPLAPLFPVG